MNDNPARVKNKKFSHISDMISDILAKYAKNLDKDMLKIWRIWKNSKTKRITNNGQELICYYGSEIFWRPQ